MYSSSWTLVYVHACTCTACMNILDLVQTQHTPINQPLHAQYTYIYSEHYSLRHYQIPILVFLRRYIKSPVFLNIRTLIRSCDEYKFVFPPHPLSHCTLVLCCCVRRQSSPSPSVHSPCKHHMTATVGIAIKM